MLYGIYIIKRIESEGLKFMRFLFVVYINGSSIQCFSNFIILNLLKNIINVNERCVLLRRDPVVNGDGDGDGDGDERKRKSKR